MIPATELLWWQAQAETRPSPARDDIYNMLNRLDQADQLAPDSPATSQQSDQ